MAVGPGPALAFPVLGQVPGGARRRVPRRSGAPGVPAAEITPGQPLEVRNFGTSAATFNPRMHQKPLRAEDLRTFVREFLFCGRFAGASAPSRGRRRGCGSRAPFPPPPLRRGASMTPRVSDASGDGTGPALRASIPARRAVPDGHGRGAIWPCGGISLRRRGELSRACPH